MYKCLDNIHPTDETVRQWAYDLDLIFTEQDEDLILYSHEYVSVLMELSSNSSCPKNDYCFSILTDYARKQLLTRNKVAINLIEKHISSFNKPLSETVKKWELDFLAMSELINKPRPIDDLEADSIAFYLLVGLHSTLNFQKHNILFDGMIEYEASSSGYKEFVYIHKETSFWRFSLSRLKK